MQLSIQGTRVLYPEFIKSSVPDPHLVRIRSGMICKITYLFFEFNTVKEKERGKKNGVLLLIRPLNRWVLYPRFSRDSVLNPDPDSSRILNTQYKQIFFGG